MRQTLRVQLSLKIAAFNLLKQYTPKNKSMSELVSELILQKLQNPLTALKDEKRQLLIKINEVDDKIKHIEKTKDDKNKTNSDE